jgi:predicted RNase H-related nuclease YkuK (DUF458 family)
VRDILEKYLLTIETYTVNSRNYELNPQENTTISVKSYLLSEIAKIENSNNNTTLKSGDVLTASIEGSGLELAGELRYEWYVDDNIKIGDILSTYILKSEDEGKDVRVEITAEKAKGISLASILAKMVSISNIKKSDNRYGIRFAQNIVSDKAEISIILPNGDKPTETKIVIYDMTGNVVFVGANLRVCPFVWNLTNNAGRNVANGTYLVIAEVVGAGSARPKYRYSAKLGVKR